MRTKSAPECVGGPIEHENLDDKVYARVRDMIVSGRYEPGSRIVQEDLAGELGVSRTPLVNALKRLAQDAKHPLSHDAAWREALQCVLGEEAADLEALAKRKRQALGGQHVPLGLGDLFFDQDDPLHPDLDAEDDDDDGQDEPQ